MAHHTLESDSVMFMLVLFTVIIQARALNESDKVAEYDE